MDENTWKIRTIKLAKGGAPKRHTQGTAAKLVASGDYVYADDGPDDSKKVKQKVRINKVPSPNMDAPAFGHLFLDEQDGSKKEPRAKKDMNKLSSEEKANIERQINTAAAIPQAAISPDKGINALKDAIQRSREARDRTKA